MTFRGLDEDMRGSVSAWNNGRMVAIVPGTMVLVEREAVISIENDPRAHLYGWASGLYIATIVADAGIIQRERAARATIDFGYNLVEHLATVILRVGLLREHKVRSW